MDCDGRHRNVEGRLRYLVPAVEYWEVHGTGNGGSDP